MATTVEPQLRLLGASGGDASPGSDSGLDGDAADMETLKRKAFKECHNELLKEAQSQLGQIFVMYEEKLMMLLQEAMDTSKTEALDRVAQALSEEQRVDLKDFFVSEGVQPRIRGKKPKSQQETHIMDSEGQMIEVGRNGGGLDANLGEIDLEHAEYNVEDYYKNTGIAQKIARSGPFSFITLIVIAVNALYLGLDADMNSADLLIEADIGWIICENIFCVLFTAEIVIRFMAFKDKINCLRDGWFKFDFCLVALMIFDVWVMLIAGVLGVRLLPLPTAPLRLIRLLRLSRIVRLMRSMPELVTMVKGMWAASRAVLCSVIMILLLVYMFSIVMLMLCAGISKGDSEEAALIRGAFGRLSLCMWTMLMDGTFMTETGEVLMALRDVDHVDGYLAVVVFVTFLLLSTLTILNMLIGFLCEVVAAVSQRERDEADLRLVKRSILRALQKFDTDGDGTISQVELECVMRSKQSQAVLENLEVDAAALDEIHAMFFKNPTDKITIPTVMETCLTYRGSQSATVKHLVDGMVFNRHYTEKLVRESMQDLQRTVIRQNQSMIKALESYSAPVTPRVAGSNKNHEPARSSESSSVAPLGLSALPLNEHWQSVSWL